MTDAIIDPPVGPYSDRVEIEAWIRWLERQPASDARDSALSEARNWLQSEEGTSKD